MPSAVARPATSRQRPDCTPVTVPLEFSCHCWLAWPLQVQTIALVPGVVPCAAASRQSVAPLTVTVNRPDEVLVQLWFAPPVQARICCRLPGAVLASVRHLPASTARSAPVVPPPEDALSRPMKRIASAAIVDPLTGSSCPAPARLYASTWVTPAPLSYRVRVQLAAGVSVADGVWPTPRTSVHCLTSSPRRLWLSVVSAVPCHSCTRGRGPV